MTPPRSLLSVLLVAALASDALAAPALRLSWDTCDPPKTDREWSGPGTYSQVISVTGLNAPLLVFRLSIAVGTSVPDAWSFSYGGCQGPERLTALGTGGGCANIPGLTVTADMRAGVTDHRWHVFVLGYFDPSWVPDPGTRYTLAVLSFDHSHSATGPQDPAVACGDADRGMCFGFEGASYSPVIGNDSPFLLENYYVTWQDPNNATDCPRSTPVRSTTWGRVKQLYR